MTRQTLATNDEIDGAPAPEAPTARTPTPAAEPTSSSSLIRSPSKLDRLTALLQRPGGASLTELMAATDWQAHSVRGALAGALRKRGHVILSEKIDGVRQYRIASPGADE